MLLKMFSIYDAKAKAYFPPFLLANQAMAVRVLSDCVNDVTHAFYRNPSDYSLFEVGTFDDAFGLIVPTGKPVFIGLAAQYKIVGQPVEFDGEILLQEKQA